MSRVKKSIVSSSIAVAMMNRMEIVTTRNMARALSWLPTAQVAKASTM